MTWHARNKRIASSEVWKWRNEFVRRHRSGLIELVVCVEWVSEWVRSVVCRQAGRQVRSCRAARALRRSSSGSSRSVRAAPLETSSRPAAPTALSRRPPGNRVRPGSLERSRTAPCRSPLDCPLLIHSHSPFTIHCGQSHLYSGLEYNIKWEGSARRYSILRDADIIL